MKKTEIILVAITVLAIVANLFFRMPGSAILLTLAMLALAVFYSAVGFAIFNNLPLKRKVDAIDSPKPNTLELLLAIIGGCSIAVLLMALLFSTLLWPGARLLLLVGFIATFIVLIVGALRYGFNQSAFFPRFAKRAIVVGGIALCLLLLPEGALFAYKYRQFPDYVKAVERSLADPQNQKLQHLVDIEYGKMIGDTLKIKYLDHNTNDTISDGE